MSSKIQEKIGGALSGMVEKADAHPVITSCALCALGTFLLLGTVFSPAGAGAAASMSGLSMTMSVVAVGGVGLFYGGKFILNRFGDRPWAQSLQKAARVALPMILGAAFLATSVGVGVHVAVAGAHISGMTEIFQYALGLGAGSIGLYGAGNLFSKGKEHKRWYRRLHYSGVVASAVIIPLGYIALCGALVSIGPTSELFYGGLIGLGFAPEVFTLATSRLFEPRLKTENHKQKSSPEASSLEQAFRWYQHKNFDVTLGRLSQVRGRHKRMALLFPAKITQETLEKAPDELRESIGKAFEQSLEFYGLELKEKEVVRQKDFLEKTERWLYKGSRHYQDLTRMLRVARLAGLERLSDSLHRCLEKISDEASLSEIDAFTRGAWQGASGAKDD